MREAGRNEKRARILEAASRVFASRGYLSSTVSQVAREAGVADGTIYLYFQSKDHLLLSLVEARMDELCSHMEGQLASIDCALEKVRAFVRTHLELVTQSPEEAQVLITELRQSAPTLKAEIATSMRPYLALLGGILEEGIAAGAMRQVDPRPIRHAIFGALDEVALAWLLKGRRFDLQANAEQLADLFVRGLAAPTQRSTR